MKLDDIKTMWPVLTALVVLSGFYYTTQLRLDHLEMKVVQLEVQVDKNNNLSNELKSLKRKVNKLSKSK